jgi:hypothetical protein
MKSLKINLYVLTGYLTIVGVLYLFLPEIGEQIFQTTLPDRITSMLHGFGTLMIAYLVVMVAGKLETYRPLLRLIQVFAVGEGLIFAFTVLAGMATFAQVGPPLIIWSVFAVLLFVFERNS